MTTQVILQDLFSSTASGYWGGEAGASEVDVKTRHHILDTIDAMITGSRLKPGEAAIKFELRFRIACRRSQLPLKRCIIPIEMSRHLGTARQRLQRCHEASYLPSAGFWHAQTKAMRYR